MVSKDALKIIQELASLTIIHATQFPSNYVLVDAIKMHGLALQYLDDGRLWFLFDDNIDTKTGKIEYKNSDGSIGTITLDLYANKEDAVFTPVIAICENISDLSFWTYTFTHGGVFTLSTKCVVDTIVAKCEKCRKNLEIYNIDDLIYTTPCIHKQLRKVIKDKVYSYMSYLNKKEYIKYDIKSFMHNTDNTLEKCICLAFINSEICDDNCSDRCNCKLVYDDVLSCVKDTR